MKLYMKMYMNINYRFIREVSVKFIQDNIKKNLTYSQNVLK